MAENYAFRMKAEFLSHHGIEGQKWGVRNGPPYPLGSGQHSAAEKRATKKESKKIYKNIEKEGFGFGRSPNLYRTLKANQKASDYINERLKNDPRISELKQINKEYEALYEDFQNSKEGRKFIKEELEREWGLNKDDYMKDNRFKNLSESEIADFFFDEYMNESDVLNDYYWKFLDKNKNAKAAWDNVTKRYDELNPTKIYTEIASDLLGDYSDYKIKKANMVVVDEKGNYQIVTDPPAKTVIAQVIRDIYAGQYVSPWLDD